jgi:hypothetical protein
MRAKLRALRELCRDVVSVRLSDDNCGFHPLRNPHRGVSFTAREWSPAPAAEARAVARGYRHDARAAHRRGVVCHPAEELGAGAATGGVTCTHFGRTKPSFLANTKPTGDYLTTSITHARNAQRWEIVAAAAPLACENFCQNEPTRRDSLGQPIG